MKQHSGWGGRREGAGGKPKPKALKQRNRVAIMLTDAELAQLRRHAAQRSLGTVARELMLAALRRRA
jgi:hypothetical protein